MSHLFGRGRYGLLAMGLALAVMYGTTHTAQAQFFGRSAVGGVKIDVDGVVSNPEQGELKELQSAWQAGMQPVPADLDAFAELRFVSLRSLEAAVAKARADGQPIPDAVRYLAGLQRVRYVLVYPDKHDIVLAGPAEGWRVDSLGTVVGKSSGRPVLLLDDLMVALRVAESSNMTGISCSIDPTPEGIERMRQLARQLSPADGPQVAARQMEEAVGQQVITVTGVPTTSHFARAMVAADFRMKRIGMDFERAPVDGLPSYLGMLTGRERHSGSMLPRWWLAPDYEPIRRDKEGLAWEIRGQAVKCLTEQDAVSAGGARKQTGQTDPVAKRWADLFTQKFDELAREDSAFGSLRNVMDLAVVSALLSKEGLTEYVGLEMPQLMGGATLEQYPAPRAVASQASFVKKQRNWVLSVSGGVQIYPWQIADRTEIVADLATPRQQADQPASASWWWQP
jgi:Protein of unknown function (DUF1598)